VEQVFWRVFDQGHYVASQRTWYRVAAQRRMSGDRRRQSTHPPRTIPQLVATDPNQVWSWDITQIPVQVQKTPLHLYLIEDVFSRKCVGWRLEQREKDEPAADLIEDAVLAERAKPHTLHPDGGRR
jgi:putative transposase